MYARETLTSVTAHLYYSLVESFIYSDLVGLSHFTVIDQKHEKDHQQTKPSVWQVM
jgi:hypothetical protein